jgi:hypothetical protein
MTSGRCAAGCKQHMIAYVACHGLDVCLDVWCFSTTQGWVISGFGTPVSEISLKCEMK